MTFFFLFQVRCAEAMLVGDIRVFSRKVQMEIDMTFLSR